ncbi:Hypothetical predicted protein [Olea europaea subsp. europaea]|uniref:Uncharacterized protein n=1 Tax=Olea europaea subsp. europaea TaxID=158383 RepID=A0A8S0UCG1_OLEEU|nr:Hypothetical predicted protein [Olea europaea subsp. europaea]
MNLLCGAAKIPRVGHGICRACNAPAAGMLVVSIIAITHCERSGARIANAHAIRRRHPKPTATSSRTPVRTTVRTKTYNNNWRQIWWCGFSIVVSRSVW